MGLCRGGLDDVETLRARVEGGEESLTEDVLRAVIAMLDAGALSVVYQEGGVWCVNVWVKRAILAFFRLVPPQFIEGGFWDKIPLKFSGWGADDFKKSGVRVVPGAIVRYGAYVAPQAVIMPSFINIGAHVGRESMIDTWATVGSCAYVGSRVHISGGAGIGGVLEPLQAAPVIIEDDCFVGARSEIAEGVRVGRGSVIAMGTFISASTKIIDRQTGKVHVGCVPPFSVVVPGSYPTSSPSGCHLSCAVIVKTVDEKTRKKTSITQLLR